MIDSNQQNIGRAMRNSDSGSLFTKFYNKESVL